MALLLALGLVFGASSKSHAVPELQLDIAGGYYDTSTQTIVANGNLFTLYAFLVPDEMFNLVSDTYFISAAIIPKIGPEGMDLGSFTFNGDTIDVTADMTYGVPPIEEIVCIQGWDAGDLSKHSVFPTYFSEFDFAFSASNLVKQYNTQDRATSGSTLTLEPYTYPGSGEFKGMYYASFSVDISLLDPEYLVHFDLYNTKIKCRTGDIDIREFAPFSHDAESGYPVPEPSTYLLLGSGLAAIIYLRKKHKI